MILEYRKTLLNDYRENTLELWGKPLESRDTNSWSNICSNIWQRWILRRSLRSRFSHGGGHSKSSCKERLPVLSDFWPWVKTLGPRSHRFGHILKPTLGVCLEMGDTFLTNDMILYRLYVQHGQNMGQNMVYGHEIPYPIIRIHVWYIWYAMDPIKKYPLYVSINIPAPWIRHGYWQWIDDSGALASWDNRKTWTPSTVSTVRPDTVRQCPVRSEF